MSMKVSTILDQIDMGHIALPKFQRGYVWNRDQVRGLIQSLYMGHPVGSLLLWNTRTEVASANVRGNKELAAGMVSLLLDGQQRITTLYGIIKGKHPPFFEGDPSTFSNLYFNLEKEEFKFYSTLEMKDKPLWINITHLIQNGIAAYIQPLGSLSLDSATYGLYINRLNTLANIKDKELNHETVDSDRDIDEVVEIFNKVNSGGTKLSKGDLALARVCAAWPNARDELRKRLTKWEGMGFQFELDWLMRCITANVTGEAFFSSLKEVKTPAISQGLINSENVIDYLINLISSRLGLDYDRVLGSRYSFPVMGRYISQRGGYLTDHRDIDKLLYWFIHTFLWGRYSGSTESVISQDLEAIKETDKGLDNLIGQLRQNRGDLRVYPGDFNVWGMGARFYPMLYMMSRVRKTRDLSSGLELSAHLLGHLSGLQVHHIFPKDLLYKNNYSKAQVNAIANLTFLTQQTNLEISNHLPEEYLAKYSSNPGVIESHWIPTNPELWKVENYPKFLEERRNLLAQEANKFLDQLLNGEAPQVPVGIELVTTTGQTKAIVVIETSGSENDEEEKSLTECNQWVETKLLPTGLRNFQLTDEQGHLLAVLDLAWPRGLQIDYSAPVAVLLDEPSEVKDIAQQKGFRYFTSIESFKEYVEQEILSLA